MNNPPSRISPSLSPLHSSLSNNLLTSSSNLLTSSSNLLTSSAASPPHNIMRSSPLHLTSTSPFLPSMSNRLQTTSPIVRGFQAPFMGGAGASFLSAPVSTSVSSSPKLGADKWTQTSLTPPSTPPATDPALFCNVLCNMLLDRIKDTLQDAIKTYSNDAERMDKMKNIVTEALNSAGSDIDKKLSIVSVQSLIPRPSHDDIKCSGGSGSGGPAPAGGTSPDPHHHPVSTAPSFPPSSSTSNNCGSPETNTPAASSHVSDYINRLSFIYGLSRPSMFNPYVKAPKAESDDKKGRMDQTTSPGENIQIDNRQTDATVRKSTSESHTMEVDSSTDRSPLNRQHLSTEDDIKQHLSTEDDINIVDDEEEEEDMDEEVALCESNEFNKSLEEQISTSPVGSIGHAGIVEGAGSSLFSSPASLSHIAPIAPIPLNLSPAAMQEKIQASLAANGFVDPAVQYELQKLLLSAAIAQGNLPAFTPPLLSTKEGDPRSDIPVMIPSNGSFFDKREYNCQHCEASFSYGSKLRAHLICVHSIKSYQCRQCRKSFLDKEEYVKHLDLHPQRKFQCDKCPSSFDKQHQLSLHYRSHTNEKPYRCQICQRQFAVNDALIRHMRIHTGERPYACNVCGKRFAQKSGLTYHSYLHTGNRPYKCTTCGQGFVHRQALKQHLMKNHLNEQVGRILNSNNNSSIPFNPAQSSSGVSWDKDSLVTAEAMKRAFPWESKEQPSSNPFKIEGIAS